ncbi:hypothetical protein [Qipengyuania flava]|uniref:hypothetical protein n=1 Tax=Qipengyuania flava TaxID=192812 RepID=UPI001C625A4B|nr:hypothetical protein [Qipengyuania flava]QYJ08109.1 hypothetical protein KUV82_05240 [Qipengyuania flava]
MKILDTKEIASVGGATIGEYLGDTFSAVCGAITGSVSGAATCEAAGTFLGGWADSVSGDGVATVSDPMDTKLGIGN